MTLLLQVVKQQQASTFAALQPARGSSALPAGGRDKNRQPPVFALLLLHPSFCLIPCQHPSLQVQRYAQQCLRIVKLGRAGYRVRDLQLQQLCSH